MPNRQFEFYKFNAPNNVYNCKTKYNLFPQIAFMSQQKEIKFNAKPDIINKNTVQINTLSYKCCFDKGKLLSPTIMIFTAVAEILWSLPWPQQVLCKNLIFFFLSTYLNYTGIRDALQSRKICCSLGVSWKRSSRHETEWKKNRVY